ncbi:PH domain-containing protein [Oceanobacillus salinisoli]|uniref:PH domain-containing protein n=1 Tax=Oceanobacillus salinisoli TaxID=2678611 RepID=UPI0012E32051|nr:PH domain-containing protein [Oceanobacillus salinisoli]
MREPPKNRIALDAIKAWKITAIIYISGLWLLTIGTGVAIYIFDFPYWVTMIAVLISILSTYFFVFVLPALRWKRWRYEIFEQEIYIQYGIWVMTRTLVPMIRVQHVDTKQGPVLKKFRLASVTISTAATTHEIPALNEEDAGELRDRISALARVDEDDV